VPGAFGAGERKTTMAANETTTLETVRDAAGGRLERARLFLSEVRNELKRVTWPSQKEVSATTVVVILTSLFFGIYLFALDYGLNSLVVWIFRRFGGV
jgi:preprotein translocase subunit SecE